MKKTLFVLALSLILTTCKDEEKEVKILAVETVSAEVRDDGSVFLTGKILADAGSPGTELGFGIGLEPPQGDNNFLIKNSNINGRFFTATRSDFYEYKNYYFWAYAKSGDLYTKGKIIIIDNVKAKPVSAPCTPTMNTVNHGVGNPDENLVNIGVSRSPDAWHLFAKAKITYQIIFEKNPSTGIYTTVQSDKPKGKSVCILLYDATGEYPIDPGSSVYVNQTGPNKWDITVCEAPFDMVVKLKLTMHVQCEG